MCATNHTPGMVATAARMIGSATGSAMKVVASHSAIALSTSLEQRADEAAARNVFPRSSGLLLDRSVTVRQRAAGRLESLLHLNAEQQGDPVDEREVGDDEHGIEDGAVVEPSVAQRAHVRFRGGGRFERGAARPEQQR